MKGAMNNTCCFTGRSYLPAEQVGAILANLEKEIERLIKSGVTTFISGGTVGFEQIAASVIALKKEMGYDVRLVMALPGPGQETPWNEQERRHFRNLLAAADAVEYVSDTFSDKDIKKRDRYMIDRSAYCICALPDDRRSTGQTVRYARLKRRHVINVAR
jgi:uncharacterized phage-like protein YoqJ